MPTGMQRTRLLLVWMLGRAAQSRAEGCWRDLACSGPVEAAFPGPWEANNFSPGSRTLEPVAILCPSKASVLSAWPPPAPGLLLAGNGSAVVLDFGREVGGIVTVEYAATAAAGQVGLAFTEAKTWIGLRSDSSNGRFRRGDGAVYSAFAAPANYTYTMHLDDIRGGFRYLTLFLLSAAEAASVRVSNVSLDIAFEPTWANLRAYQGYFHCSDDILNKIWYSGAYTLQTNAVPVSTGRNTVDQGWSNGGRLSNGSTVLVDGAKRDRAVWPGDMAIAVPATFVSLGGALDSVRNALQVIYDYQNTDGSFPEAGPPLLQQGSDTYHMWTMIGTYNYLLYTNDTAFLALNWPRYLRAMDHVYAKVQPASGLLNVTAIRDWARWQQGFNNTQANVILYRTLTTASDLATWMADPARSALYQARASNLSEAINRHCFDQTYGAFRDNATDTELHPQDANSMAVLFGLVHPASARASSISQRLTDNWTDLGAEAPELPGNISPFISGFEIQAHLTTGQTARALDLVRRSWGWYLQHPNGTGSTVIEGYRTDGSFAYRSTRGYQNDASYTSHAHGWSAGPTIALTTYLVGLAVTGPAGSTWTLRPQLAGLTSAQAGFVTPLGRFRAAWNATASGTALELRWDTPEGTTGEVTLPTPPPAAAAAAVVLDGRPLHATSFAIGGGEHVLTVA